MPNKAELLRALIALETTLQRAAELSIDSKREMIQMRRDLYEHYAMIGVLGHDVFDGHDGRTGFQQELSKVRMAIAAFQSQWPVVTADASNPDYVRSLNQARDANRTFIAWIRRELGAG